MTSFMQQFLINHQQMSHQHDEAYERSLQPTDEKPTMTKMVMLNLIVIRSKSSSTLAEWYEDFLMQLSVEEKHGGGPLHYSIQLGETTLEIYPAANNSSQTEVTFGILVDKASFERMKSKSERVKELDDSSCIVMDPEGNRIIIQCVKA
jgi:hypothetical protein